MCVLSAAGTAAVISLQYTASELDTSGGGANTTVNVTSTEKQATHLQPQPLIHTTQLEQSLSEQVLTEQQIIQCQPPPQPQAPQGLQPQKPATKQTHDRVAMTTSLDRTDFEKDRGSGGKTDSTSLVSTE